MEFRTSWRTQWKEEIKTEVMKFKPLYLESQPDAMEKTPTPEELAKRLEEIVKRQQQLQQEITGLRQALYDQKQKESAESKDPISTEPENKINSEVPIQILAGTEVVKEPENKPPFTRAKKERTPVEEFIGTNLLNKIGIGVLVIGIGIGAEYAIDHELISPLTRIVLGYLCGVVLIGLAIRLKLTYQNFSAVLLSGGMAVLYFISFAAYDLYALFPLEFAFALMVIFTAFTVFAALRYDLQVVAIIGLVGAYAVPFLLSDGSGRVVALFSYMVIINAGILTLAFKKYWRQLYYLAFGLTWLIFTVWYLDQYKIAEHLLTELIFSTLFFGTLYATFLSNKLIRKETLSRWDIVLLLLNSFLYYGAGYLALDSDAGEENFLGLFTLFNALLHSAACLIIFKRQEQSSDIFFFTAGLVLLFLTLAVPVQLEGNWVTIIWAGEATLLFWIGRSKSFPVYEKLSYPLIVLAFGSLILDWNNFYGHYSRGVAETFVRPFFNVQLLSSLLVALAFGGIVKISCDKKYFSPLTKDSAENNLLPIAVVALLLITLYFSFLLEVDSYWQQRFIDSELSGQYANSRTLHVDYDLLRFKNLWIFNYSAFFIFVVALINRRWTKNKLLDYGLVAFSSLAIFSFITSGLNDLGDLRLSYLSQTDAQYYLRDSGHFLIRYICIAFLALLLWINYTFTRRDHFQVSIRKAEHVFYHVVILSLLSTELTGGLAMAHIVNSNKLALSLLWGAYALGLIIYGLARDLKHIRILAIAVFGITLMKLFFYDLADMGTIAKTMVMIILGVLLLVASFLYNKFRKPHEQN